MTRLAFLLLCLAVCRNAAAGENPAPPDAGAAPKADCAETAVRRDPLLGRLGLTDEQIAAAARAHRDWAAKAKAAFSGTSESGTTGKGASGKAATDGGESWKRHAGLAAERDAAIAALLTDEQTARRDAGLRLLADYRARLQTLYAERQKAQQEFRGDRAKLKTAMADFAARCRELLAERDRLLDEQVGQLPAPPGKDNAGTGTGDGAEKPPTPEAGP